MSANSGIHHLRFHSIASFFFIYLISSLVFTFIFRLLFIKCVAVDNRLIDFQNFGVSDDIFQMTGLL